MVVLNHQYFIAKKISNTAPSPDGHRQEIKISFNTLLQLTASFTYFHTVKQHYKELCHVNFPISGDKH